MYIRLTYIFIFILTLLETSIFLRASEIQEGNLPMKPVYYKLIGLENVESNLVTSNVKKMSPEKIIPKSSNVQSIESAIEPIPTSRNLLTENTCTSLENSIESFLSKNAEQSTAKASPISPKVYYQKGSPHNQNFRVLKNEGCPQTTQTLKDLTPKATQPILELPEKSVIYITILGYGSLQKNYFLADLTFNEDLRKLSAYPIWGLTFLDIYFQYKEKETKIRIFEYPEIMRFESSWEFKYFTHNSAIIFYNSQLDPSHLDRMVRQYHSLKKHNWLPPYQLFVNLIKEDTPGFKEKIAKFTQETGIKDYIQYSGNRNDILNWVCEKALQSGIIMVRKKNDT
jgi:hypothetical protein